MIKVTHFLMLGVIFSSCHSHSSKKPEAASTETQPDEETRPDEEPKPGSMPTFQLTKDSLYSDRQGTLHWSLPLTLDELFVAKKTELMLLASKEECPLRTKRLLVPTVNTMIGLRPRFDFSLDWQASAKDKDTEEQVFDIRMHYALQGSEVVNHSSFPIYVHQLVSKDGLFYSTNEDEFAWYMSPVAAPVQWVELEVCKPLKGITRFEAKELGLILFLPGPNG